MCNYLLPKRLTAIVANPVILFVVLLTLHGIPEDSYSETIIDMLSEHVIPLGKTSDLKNMFHRKNLFIVFVPLSQEGYAVSIGRIANRCKSKNFEIYVINTEDFISESECQKILLNYSVEATIILGTKLSNWNSISSYLANQQANAFLVDRAGKIHKFKMSSVDDADKIAASFERLLTLKKTPHTVQKGETLSLISRKYYGTFKFWNEIYKANRDQIRDPQMIYPGQVLLIPLIK